MLHAQSATQVVPLLCGLVFCLCCVLAVVSLLSVTYRGFELVLMQCVAPGARFYEKDDRLALTEACSEDGVN